MPTKREWQQMLEQRLPSKDRYTDRNRAITAYYAQCYLQQPDVFKWAGMAAFASYQVGVGLQVAEMLMAPRALAAVPKNSAGDDMLALSLQLYQLGMSLAFTVPIALHDAATRPLLLNDLDLLKQGNDQIFDDVAWAHLAYAQSGIDEIEANVAESEQPYLLQGFRMIDAGVKKLADPDQRQAGKALIRDGNITLLRHEQQVTVPGVMDRLTQLGKLIVSLGGALDFQKADQNSAGGSWFSGYFGLLPVLSGQVSLARFEDRWRWLEGEALPLWDKIDAAYAPATSFHQRLVSMAECKPSLLQQITDLMTNSYQAVGLQLSRV
ncbi:hypothetical protein K2Z83_24305 [Oscillochloris sp. ZM17-4]|uniref:DUF2515 family protein n=1 Tax=Oscillochloris sp. ZM17-4 TaxID=2866714 RepID=UPI001C737A6C|nr:hypothetical protein [Oscillochloris sp. ZM17-4]MBX0330784.1 hypothetical protein [Oscillochloris sp. ZM17-4]